MLAAERQAKIVQEIQRRGAANVADLVDLFGVSDMTIRRDLDVLAQQGLVDKLYGGATRRARRTHEPGFAAKWAAGSSSWPTTPSGLSWGIVAINDGTMAGAITQNPIGIGYETGGRHQRR